MDFYCLSASEVQCCGSSTSTLVSEGSCTRAGCLSGNNDAAKFMYYEAVDMCGAEGLPTPPRVAAVSGGGASQTMPNHVTCDCHA